jgi:hypothetical protein
VRLVTRLLIAFTTLSLLGALPAFAEKRTVVSAAGKISHLKNGKDRKHKRYWEYQLRTASGQTVLVHDYQYGRYRQPATMGIQEGAKRSVRGFYVHIATKAGSTKKVPVLIVSPAN